MIVLGVLGLLPAYAIVGARAETVVVAPLLGAGIVAVGAWIEVAVGGDLRLLALGVGIVAWVVSGLRVRTVLRETVDARSLLLLIGPLVALAWTLRALERFELYADARSIWLFHARMLYGGHHTYLSVAPQTVFSHPDYPLLGPASIAATWEAAGRIEYRTAQLMIAALTACGVILVGLCVARATNCPVVLAFLASAALCVVLYGVFGEYATNGYMDPLCGSLTTAAFGYGLLVKAERWSQSLSLVLLVLTAAVKNEGLAYAAIGLVALLVLRLRLERDQRLKLRGYGLTVVGLLAWPVIVRLRGIGSDLTHGPSGPVQHPGYRFSQLVHPEIARYGAFPAAVGAVLVVVVLRRSRRDGAILYLATILCAVVALNLVYVFGPDEIMFWIRTSLNRTTQTIEDLCLLVITVAAVLGVMELVKVRPARHPGAGHDESTPAHDTGTSAEHDVRTA